MASPLCGAEQKRRCGFPNTAPAHSGQRGPEAALWVIRRETNCEAIRSSSGKRGRSRMAPDGRHAQNASPDGRMTSSRDWMRYESVMRPSWTQGLSNFQIRVGERIFLGQGDLQLRGGSPGRPGCDTSCSMARRRWQGRRSV